MGSYESSIIKKSYVVCEPCVPEPLPLPPVKSSSVPSWEKTDRLKTPFLFADATLQVMFCVGYST